MEHSFYLKINNNQGLIARIALLLERRGYSITYLMIEMLNENGLAVMELRTKGALSKKALVMEQLKKLIDVLDIELISYNQKVSRVHCAFSFNRQQNFLATQ